MADLIFPDYIAPSDYSEWTYSTGWTTGQADNSGHNSRKYATATAVGEKATCQSGVAFTDAVIYMFGSRFAGLVDILVDGEVKYSNFDCYLYIDGSTNSMKNVPMIYLSGLSRTTHKIEIVCKGASGSKSTGTTVGVNFIYFMDPDTPVGTAQNSKLLFVGDSNSDRQGGWCDKQFKRLLNSFQLGNRVQIEYSTRPSGSSDYIRFLENDIIAKRPAMINLMLGTNDLPNQDINTKANIETAIKICQKYGVSIQLCTILPRLGLNAFSWNKVNGQIRELAMKYRLPLLDINVYVANNTTSAITPFQSDGIHLDAVGDNLAAHHLFDTFFAPGNPFRKLL